MQANPFWPKSPTVTATLTSAALASAVSPSTGGGFDNYRLVNISTGPAVFVGMGTTSSLATPTLPLTSAASTGTLGFHLLQNQEIIVQGPPNAYFNAMTTGTGLVAILCVQAGAGKK